MSSKQEWAQDKAGNKVATMQGPTSHLVTKTGDIHTQRFRTTIANVNAGATLLAAKAGFKYRLIDVIGISVGGAAGSVTTVDVLGTQSASGVKLAAFAQAQLTQSTVLRPGVSGCAVLTDGASFIACDVNTAITIGKTGSDVDTATHIDVILTYAVDEA